MNGNVKQVSDKNDAAPNEASDQTDSAKELPGYEGSMAQQMRQLVERGQELICTKLESYEHEASFRRDSWNREEGGGGLTRVLENGEVIEKGGVNTSAVHGQLPERMATVLGVEPLPFFATGLSLVLHPVSPFVPTVHANFRYFALGENLSDPADQWFGGGADLTPVYPFFEDAVHFHETWRNVCSRHPDVASYDSFKKACDEYFYLPHRNEARGVGGIFYDYLRSDVDELRAFSADATDSFLPSYIPILERRIDLPFHERERRFQRIRRGRYVEFNLVYDRGTKFGLETDGRTESILMSLPLHVQWPYNWKPEPASKEERAMWYFTPRDWLNIDRAKAPDDPL